MNPKSWLILLVFIGWVLFCWQRYTCGIKGFCIQEVPYFKVEKDKTSNNVIKDAEQKTADIHQSAVDIKKSIDSGNLQEAVNKLRDLNETVVTTQQKIVENTNKK